MPEFKEIVEDLRTKGIDIERPVEKCQGFHFGERVRVDEDDPYGYAYTDDTGICVPEEVGDEAHRNKQIKMYLLIDGMGSSVEVDPENLESI
jgi:hypothetical protein